MEQQQQSINHNDNSAWGSLRRVARGVVVACLFVVVAAAATCFLVHDVTNNDKSVQRLWNARYSDRDDDNDNHESFKRRSSSTEKQQRTSSLSEGAFNHRGSARPRGLQGWSSSYSTTSDASSSPLPKTLQDMMQELELARGRFYSQLQRDYGSDCMTTLFQPNVPFLQSPMSSSNTTRFRRKLQIKLLKVLIQGQQQPWVWATGGHSAAAGHGNLYNESYTAVMERHGRDLFARVGLDFVARNYAMGGTSSGPEIGACVEAIFGMDIDTLSWDFGMTDGNDFELVEYYCVRANLHPNHPACVVWIQSKSFFPFFQALERVEEAGGTVVYSDINMVTHAETNLPDSANMPEAELQQLPLYTRNLKCGKQIEDGDPYCKLEKYTMTGIDACDERMGRVSWHPGWKWHALRGNIMVLGLLYELQQALDNLQQQLTNQDLPTILQHFQNEQMADLDQLRSAPRYSNDHWQGPVVCHTARLPAQTRYLGILSNNIPQSQSVPLLSGSVVVTDYEIGVSMSSAQTNVSYPGPIPLVYDPEERQSACPLVLNVDYKDYFLTLGTHLGRMELTLPNAAEQQAYLATTGTGLKGTIAICWPPCPWGRCPKGDIRLEDLQNDPAQETTMIRVNQVVVTNFVEFGRDCAFLESNYIRTWTASSDGTFLIDVDVHNKTNMVRLSSVLVW